MVPTDKKSLLNLVQKSPDAIPIKRIYNACGVDPAFEENRKKVWEIGQRLAELHMQKFITIFTFRNVRFVEVYKG